MPWSGLGLSDLGFKWFGFEPWPVPLHCVLGQEILLSVSFLTQVYKWLPANLTPKYYHVITGN